MKIRDDECFPWIQRHRSGNRVEILLDQSPDKIRQNRRKFGFQFWQLRTPLTRNRIEGTFPYALDNGCFSGDLPSAWERMLAGASEVRPIFVAVPDIVGSARRTMDLFNYFERATNGVPRALVLQDGIGDIEIPWSKIEAVFIGGSDEFKISQEAFQAARCARMLGKWVHVGRVNEIRRLQNWMDLADSIDGSGISRFDHMLKDVVALIRGSHRQQVLDLAV